MQKDPKNGFLNFFQLAERARADSRFAEALAFYRKARAQARRAGRKEEELDAEIGVGDCLRMVARFGVAQRSYERAAILADEVDYPDAAIEGLVGIGLSVRAQGNPEEAVPYLAKALELGSRSGLRARLGFVNWALGGTYRFCGDLRKANKHFATAFKFATKQGDTIGAGYSLCGLGGVARLMGDFERTQEYYDEANAIFDVENDRYGRAYSFCGLGNAARMREDFALSSRFFRRAERLYSRIGDKASFAYTLWAMGTVDKMSGHYSRSAEIFDRASELFRTTNDRRGLVYCRLGKGELAFLEGREKRAYGYFSRACGIAEKYGFHAEVCHALNCLSLVSPSADRRNVRLAYGRCGLFYNPPPPPFNIP